MLELFVHGGLPSGHRVPRPGCLREVKGVNPRQLPISRCLDLQLVWSRSQNVVVVFCMLLFADRHPTRPLEQPLGTATATSFLWGEQRRAHTKSVPLKWSRAHLAASPLWQSRGGREWKKGGVCASAGAFRLLAGCSRPLDFGRDDGTGTSARTQRWPGFSLFASWAVSVRVYTAPHETTPPCAAPLR